MDISALIVAAIFEPLGHFEPQEILDYAKEMQENETYSIGFAIIEASARFARYRQMSQAILDERGEFNFELEES